MMSRGVVYVRVSSDEQVKGMSLEFQKADCLAYAQSKGMTVDRIFEDRGESAKFANRPALIEMLDYCRKHRNSVRALIVWKLDRLSRNQLDYYYLKRTLLDLGVALHSATEPSMEDSSSIAGKVFETFSALQAELDNTMRSERARRGMEAKLLSGIYPWKPPVGYCRASGRAAGSKKTLPDEPDPKTFPILQSVLREYATGRYSQVELVKMLEKRGLAAARAQRVNHPFVSFILYRHLDFYRGVLKNRWGDEIIQGRHIPMITEDEYHRIVAVRDGRTIGAGVKRRKHNPEFPLRKTLRCAKCGEFLTASFSRGKLGGRYGYYHCRTKQCSLYGRGFRREKVEKEFEALADVHSLKPDFLAHLRRILEKEMTAGESESKHKSELLGSRLAELEKKRERIFEMREDGSYGREEFQERKTAVESEIETIKGELAFARERETKLDDVMDYALQFLSRLGGAWSQMNEPLKLGFQQLLFPDGISYDKKKGFGTPKLGLIFALNQEFLDQNLQGVRLTVASWNSILEELARIAMLSKATQDDGCNFQSRLAA